MGNRGRSGIEWQKDQPRRSVFETDAMARDRRRRARRMEAAGVFCSGLALTFSVERVGSIFQLARSTLAGRRFAHRTARRGAAAELRAAHLEIFSRVQQ